MKIRWMTQGDIDEALEIERESFEYAWDDKDFAKVIRSKTCAGMVVERRDEIVGYVLYECFRDRIEVLNFAVAVKHRRDGVGAKMVEAMVEKLTDKNAPKHIVLMVRESNLAAQLFFKACGFRAVRMHKGYYEDTSEDAIQMRYGAGRVFTAPRLSPYDAFPAIQ
jgi:ribosomal-protein-alanine N-acetyltransferase